MYFNLVLQFYMFTMIMVVVSTGGIRWILWFCIPYAATTAYREIFGVNTLRGKLHQLGSSNLLLLG